LTAGSSRGVLRAPLFSLFVGQRLLAINAEERKDTLEQLAELNESGKVTPIIDRTYPLADAAEAVRHLEEGHAAGKIVVTI
jgi:NADPH:quinone reductase-like Zn-dependent oxidoreductase